MARIYRPHIPLSVRILVATRQGYQAGFNPPARDDGESMASLLARQMNALAAAKGCTAKDLRLDHDPPLAARPRYRRGLGRKTYYQPPANDPDHLFYRPHGAQFDGSHDVKTRIRGDHGQYSDIVLIKRERRRLAKKKTKPKKRRKISTGRARRNSSGFPNRPAQVKRDTDSGVKLRPVKRKWPSRPFQNRNKP